MKNFLIICLVSSLAFPIIADAQSGAVELGFDSRIGYVLTDNVKTDFVDYEIPNMTSISLPVTGIRIGVFMTDAISIEPVLALQSFSQDGDKYTQVDAQVGALYHVLTNPKAVRPYVRVAPALIYFSGTGEEGLSQLGITGQVGVKIPLTTGFAANVAAGARRDFEEVEFQAKTTVFFTIGLSFFAGS